MFSSIVVGTDGSETAREAVSQAVELAKRLDASLHVVSAYEPGPGQGHTDEPAAAVDADRQWAIKLREEVDATLDEAATLAIAQQQFHLLPVRALAHRRST